jgi:hypothetical protein
MNTATVDSPSLEPGAAPQLMSRGMLLRASIVFLLLSTTVLQRFGLNLGSYSANVTLLAMYAVLGIAVASGRLSFSMDRVFIYVLSIALAAGSMLANVNLAQIDRSSFSSLILLAAMFFPFVFVLVPDPQGRNDADWVMRAFLNVALFCAVAGIAQFFAQFVVRPPWLFDFTEYIPYVMRGPSGYNTVIPVGSLFKSNGFFFREPSLFSFVMALALLAEGLLYRRMVRIAIFGLALLLTYSGTGILTLFIGLLFPLGLRTLLRLGAVALIGGLAVLLLGDVLNLSFTLGRIGEFGSERSSAYIRYIAPFRVIADTMVSDIWTFWLGHGPGTIYRLGPSSSYEFHDPTWAKLLFEYGVLGFVAFVAMFLVMLNRPRIPIQVRAALFFSWLIMGGHLLMPENNYLALVVVGFMPLAGGALADLHARSGDLAGRVESEPPGRSWSS